MITLVPSNSTPNAYSINWGTQQGHILDGLRRSLELNNLTDVLLATTDGQYIPAHRLILSLCSTFFADMFQKNCTDKSNTIVIVSQVTAQNLRYLIQFMYQGAVDIPSKDVDGFLQAGSLLKIEGLIGSATGRTEAAQFPQTQSTAELSSHLPVISGSSHSQPSSRPVRKAFHTTPSSTQKKASSTSGSPNPYKKSRTTEIRTGGVNTTVESSGQDGGGHDISQDAVSNPELSTTGGGVGEDGYDPLGQSEFDPGADESEEGVDFDNIKAEPIQVYSGYEAEEDQSNMDEGSETFEASGDDSFGYPASQVPITPTSAVPGPSTISHSQTNRPRGNLPGHSDFETHFVLLRGEYFQIQEAVSNPTGKLVARCVYCETHDSKKVLISGRLKVLFDNSAAPIVSNATLSFTF